MFTAPKVISVYSSIQSHISTAICSLDSCDFKAANIALDDAQSSLAKKKLTLELKDPDKVYNEYYLLEVFLRLIRNDVLFWATVSKGKFAESWSNLQDVQDDLRILKRFLPNPLPKLLVYLEDQCGQLEQLYPYRIFFSIGCIAKTLECSICGKRLDSFDCIHIMGELYRGQIACGEIGEAELEEASITPHPEDKRCTIQLLDSSPQFKAVAFLRDCLTKGQVTPFGLGRVNRSKRLVSSGELKNRVGRNDSCPCGSKRKFKKCCLAEGSIETDHFELITTNVNLDELVPTVEPLRYQ